jgi:hypothetical protein
MLCGAVLLLLLGALVAAAVPLGSEALLWPHVVLVVPGLSQEHAPQVGWWESVCWTLASLSVSHMYLIVHACVCSNTPSDLE